MNAITNPHREALLAAAAGPIEGFDVSDPALYEHQAWGPYFARLRRMVSGQHHFVSPAYLYQYATEAAWKEDHRRLDNGRAFTRTVALALASAKSAVFCGYWQRHQTVGAL